jgi:hypothetical protein
MDLSNLTTVILVILGLAIVWTILRTALKITARLFRMGCLAIVILVGGIWLLATVL